MAMGCLVSFFIIGRRQISSLFPYTTLFRSLGHYMTASGLVMGAMVLAAARLLFAGRPARPPSRSDFRALALLGEIGRASCRERVEVLGGAGSVKRTGVTVSRTESK